MHLHAGAAYAHAAPRARFRRSMSPQSSLAGPSGVIPTAGVPTFAAEDSAGRAAPSPRGKATRTYTQEQHDRRVAWGRKYGPLVGAMIRNSIREGQ